MQTFQHDSVESHFHACIHITNYHKSCPECKLKIAKNSEINEFSHIDHSAHCQVVLDRTCSRKYNVSIRLKLLEFSALKTALRSIRKFSERGIGLMTRDYDSAVCLNPKALNPAAPSGDGEKSITRKRITVCLLRNYWSLSASS